MAENQVEATIIILSKNGGDNFPKLLKSVYTQKFNGSFEVIVIDSGSTDDTVTIAQQHPVRLVQIKPDEFHHGRTRNLGADMANGTILVYITQDALPCNNHWLQKLVDTFTEPGIAYVIGRQIPGEDAKPPEKFFYHYNFPDYRIVVNQDSPDYFHDNVFISNVNSAIRKYIWQQFRFSEIINTAEDKEFAIRVLNANYSVIYNQHAAVYHSHDFTFKSAFRRYFEYGISLKKCISSLPKSKKSPIKKLAEYFQSELKFLSTNRQLQWLPYTAVYEASKYSGLFLGKIYANKSEQKL